MYLGALVVSNPHKWRLVIFVQVPALQGKDEGLQEVRRVVVALKYVNKHMEQIKTQLTFLEGKHIRHI